MNLFQQKEWHLRDSFPWQTILLLKDTGNTPEGRTRLHTLIIKSVRKSVGNDFIVALRFGACDYMEGRSEIKDIPAAARIFEQAGIDLLDISGGHCIYTIKGKAEAGWFSELSKLAKQAVKIPVMLTGGELKQGKMRKGYWKNKRHLFRAAKYFKNKKTSIQGALPDSTTDISARICAADKKLGRCRRTKNA